MGGCGSQLQADIIRECLKKPLLSLSSLTRKDNEMREMYVP